MGIIVNSVNGGQVGEQYWKPYDIALDNFINKDQSRKGRELTLGSKFLFLIKD